MRFLLRLAISAAALAVATAALPGIELTTGSTTEKVLTLIAVALIFGVINAVLKPIIKTIGCLFYLLTLGLVALVVNALLLWLVSVVAGWLKLPFHITGFVPAFLGALIISVVTWLLSVLIPDREARPSPGNRDRPAARRPARSARGRGPTADDVHADHGHHGRPVRFQHLNPRAEQPPVGLGPRRPRLDHRDPDRQFVAGTDRPQPPQLVDPGRPRLAAAGRY